MSSRVANLLWGILSTAGAQPVTALVKRTGASQPTISRALNELAQQTEHLITYREGRRVFYALNRAVRSLPRQIPIYQVADYADSLQTTLLGTLTALEGLGYLWAAAEGAGEFIEGLPWFMQDMRPQGYLGRAFCHAYAGNLGASERLADWTEDDVLCALGLFGVDVTGNLIVGDIPLRHVLEYPLKFPVHTDHSLPAFYDQLAANAVQGGAAGSSAGGEHAKFLTQYRQGKTLCHVMVKFSPLLDGSVAATRWQDLLIAEHIAAEVMRNHHIVVPNTRLIYSKKRCYLESTRFDRTGQSGRIGVVSLAAVDHAFVGAHRTWQHSATALRAQGKLSAADEQQIHLLETFGKLIANTDMHFGNLSFYWAIEQGQIHLRLAPLYDMLPMHYAPDKSEVLNRPYRLPALAGAASDQAINMAREFWQRLARHNEVSPGFRKICSSHAQH